MTTELYWTTLTVLMTALFWAPYILDRLAVRGVWVAVADTQPEEHAPHSLWAKRAIKAHQNAVENLVIFVAAVLIANALDISTPVTQGAAMAYFFARLVHFAVYTFGVPVLRTLAFLAGWLAQAAIIVTILGWI